MKNISDKTKRRMLIFGGLIISVILIILISGQFRKEPIVEAELPDESEETIDVILETPETKEEDKRAEKEVEITVPDIEISDTEIEDNGAIDTGTEQTIQGDI